MIVVNRESVNFAYQLRDGDRVSVYPVSEALAVSPLVRLDPPPLREPRFVLDVHLGRLARILRLLGFDCIWRNDLTDEDLAAISVSEQRILLTRDRGLLKRAEVAHGYLVRESDRRRQTIEVLRRFDLFRTTSPFGRCLECNGTLEPVAKEDMEHRLPARTGRPSTTSAGAHDATGSTGRALTTIGLPLWWRMSAVPARRRSRTARNELGTHHGPDNVTSVVDGNRSSCGLRSASSSTEACSGTV